jgi:OmpA-OmpF porin, OOP family
MDLIIGILVLLVLGLIVGALAKFIMPGDDPGGIVVTSILGIVGAIVGGWIASWLEVGGITGFDWRSLITAVGGSLVLLLAYRAFRMLIPHSTSPSYLAGRTGTASPLQAFSAHSDSDATNLVAELTETAKGAFTGNVLQKLSGMLGENSGATRKALEALVPTILAGMSNHASTTTGASRLFDLAKDVAQGGTDLIGRLDSHVNEHGLDALSGTGGSALSALFGDRLSGLVSWLTRFAGIKESSATSLMGVATSVVLGMLGKNIIQQGLTAATFGRMLTSLGGPLSKLLPSGIGDVPGMRALADLGDRAATTTRASVDTSHRIGATARGAYRETAGAVREGIPWLAALAPLLLLAIPLLAFTYLMSGAAATLIKKAEENRGNVPIANPTVVTTPKVQPTEIPAPPNSPPLVETTYVEKLLDVKLPDGKSLKLPAASFLNGVYRYLTDATATQGRAFTFDGLDFDAANIKMRPEAESAVTQLTTLLGAYPNVKLRIDAYTDPSNDSAADKRVSVERAEALKSLLVKAGVPADRIKTSGFGGEKPVATNNTPEDRAKNRRIELWLDKA